MRTIQVRDSQVVLILSPTSAKELRKRLKHPDAGAWTRDIRDIDYQLEEELYAIEKRG